MSRSLVSALAFLLTPVVAFAQYPVFNLKDYRCKGDGKTNDIAAFRRVAALVNEAKGGTIIFEPDRLYRVKLDEVGNEKPVSYPQENSVIMFFRNCEEVKIEMNGATIALDGNHRMEYAFFHFLGCASFSVSNGILIGDAINHDYSDIIRYDKRVQSSHEWGYGIVVNGSKGVVRGMRISYMTGDGIKSGSINLKGGTLHALLSVEDCDISFCRRNGISILSSLRTTVTRSTIHHIGSHGAITGTRPMAGIDLEYEDKVGDQGDVIISSCQIHDCTRRTVSSSNSTPPVPKSLTVENCHIQGSSFLLSNVDAGEGVYVKNCVVENAPIQIGKAQISNTKFKLGNGVHYVTGGTYTDCVFEGTLEPSSSVYGCTIAGTSLDMAFFERCTFKDIRAANNSSPSYQGFSGYQFPLCATFRNCMFSNCSFVRGNPKNKSSFAFYDSQLRDKCLIHNLSDDIPIIFDSCTLTDVSSYQTQDGSYMFSKSTIEQLDKTVSKPLLLFGTHTMDRCKVTDKVGIPVSAASRYRVNSYRINAKKSDFFFESQETITSGINLTKGSVTGVSKNSFDGTYRSTHFR